MKKTPLISIIVPVFNTELYLEKCIQSILNQTHKNFELLLINDGSCDSSGAICESFAQKDSRVRVFHKENGGQSTARNMALQIAKGEYIGFVDSDDTIDPKMYETLLESLERQKAQIAVCARYNVFPNGDRKAVFTLDQETLITKEDSLRRFLVYDCLDSSPCDKLFKAELFNGITFPSGYICEDVFPVFQLLEKSSATVHCGKPLYHYFQRNGSTSNSTFSEKSKGLEMYHKRVYLYIAEHYPSLTKQGEYFYYSRLPILYDMICKSNFNSEYKKEIQKKIRSYLLSALRCPYFSLKEKLRYFLNSIGIHQNSAFFKRLKCLIK